MGAIAPANPRPAFTTLRLTQPRMGDGDGTTDLVLAVQHALRAYGIPQSGRFDEWTVWATADWQWRVGCPRTLGALTPDDLTILLGYRDLPSSWRVVAKDRKGTQNPNRPAKPKPEFELRIIPRGEWCPFTPRGFSTVNWSPGVPHVVHWFGPGAAPDGDDAGIEMCVGFARYHQFTHGWSYFAYSYSVLRSGLVLEGRGDNVRTAATGNSVGNTYPSVMLMAGTETPEPTPEQYKALEALRQRGTWGRRLKHSELSSTSCPGPAISAFVESNR